MNEHRYLCPLTLVLLSALSVNPGSCSGDEILRAAGAAGGLVVHVGCGDGRLTAELRAGDGYLVQGLDTDAASVNQARQHIKSLGVYDEVSVDRFDGRHLPYIDNLVNLLVAEDLGEVPPAEVMRVLCPRGVAYVKKDGRWTKTVKPWPEQIDQWTHWLHGPDGNAVANDTRVGPPRHAQWIAEPRWQRHHGSRPRSRSTLRSAISKLGRGPSCDATSQTPPGSGFCAGWPSARLRWRPPPRCRK